MLSFLISAWAVLRTVVAVIAIKLRFLRIAAYYFFIISRIPGDLVINVLDAQGWLSEKHCVDAIKALIYLISGFTTITVLMVLLRQLF